MAYHFVNDSPDMLLCNFAIGGSLDGLLPGFALEFGVVSELVEGAKVIFRKLIVLPVRANILFGLRCL